MKNTSEKYVNSLLEFLDNSPCNFLAVDTVKKILTANGFKEKKIDDKMTAKAGEKFFFTKNDSAIFAVQVGKKSLLTPVSRSSPHTATRPASGLSLPARYPATAASCA